MINLESVMLHRCPADWRHAEFVQQYHLLLLVTQGTFTYYVNDSPLALAAGSLIFIPCGSRRRGEALGHDGHEKIAVRLSGEELFELFPELNGTRPFVQAGGSEPTLEPTFRAMYKIWVERGLYFAPMCSGMLIHELAVLFRERHMNERRSGMLSPIRETRQYMLDHYMEPLTVDELAQRAGRNATYFITSFRKIYGYPPMEYLHRLRIGKAEEWLLDTHKSIEWIADRLGYCDASHFYRTFKKVTGLSPTEYRLRMQ